MSTKRPIEIVVCMGSSCFSRGNSLNLAKIQEYLKTNGVEDQVQLIGSRCEGECMCGPSIRVDGKLIKGVTQDSVVELLDEVFNVAEKKA